MPFLIGITLAVAVGAFARRVGLDRDRAFYPTVMIVIACLYALFAIMADSPAVLVMELFLAWFYRNAFCPMLKMRVTPG